MKYKWDKWVPYSHPYFHLLNPRVICKDDEYSGPRRRRRPDGADIFPSSIHARSRVGNGINDDHGTVAEF